MPNPKQIQTCRGEPPNPHHATGGEGGEPPKPTPEPHHREGRSNPQPHHTTPQGGEGSNPPPHHTGGGRGGTIGGGRGGGTAEPGSYMIPVRPAPPTLCGVVRLWVASLPPPPPVVWCGSGVGFGGPPLPPPVAWCGLGGSPLHVWICLRCLVNPCS